MAFFYVNKNIDIKSIDLHYKKNAVISFTTSRKLAIEIAREIEDDYYNKKQVIISVKQNDAVLFSMQDIKKSKFDTVAITYLRLEDWHYQQEVFIDSAKLKSFHTIEIVKSNES